MEIIEKIIISEEFSDAPGARYRTDGPKSGQEFYEDLLDLRFEKVIENNGQLLIDMDNTWGYASSFLSGAFGELARKYGSSMLEKHLEIKSEDDPFLRDKINLEIKGVL